MTFDGGNADNDYDVEGHAEEENGNEDRESNGGKTISKPDPDSVVSSLPPSTSLDLAHSSSASEQTEGMYDSKRKNSSKNDYPTVANTVSSLSNSQLARQALEKLKQRPRLFYLIAHDLFKVCMLG